jgi:SPP1 gp7 family putative phage head morphogenesis protein
MGILDRFRNAKPTEEPQKKAKRIQKKTIKQQMFRFNKQIDTWKLGINCFEDVFNSTTETIIGVYNDVVIDAHLSASMDTRATKTTSKDFKVIDENGEEMEETEIFQSQWFRDFMRFSLDSKFYGYSLIQFGDRVGDGFNMVKLVPREYVYPQKQSVRTSPQNTVDLIPFNKGQYKPWTIGVGRPEDIGLLMKAAPLVIYKKTALGSWSEFTELFGSPFRFGKTDVRDEELRDNMYDMLDNMGRNAFGVFHQDDELEYIKDSQTDAHKVFNELIERSNSEISKLILGSTMTMDDGSSRSQSEVHERTSGALEKEDAIFMSEVVNKQLIPWLNTYHGFNITGKWVFDETENISKPEQFKMDIELVKNGFNVPKEYFSETYGTPIDEKEEVEETPDPKDPKQLDANNELKKKAFSLTSYEAFIEADSCDICNTIDLSDTPQPEWSDAFINEIITGVHSGLYTLTNLPESLYLETAERLTKSLLEGVAESKVIPSIADPDFIRALRNNAYVFSGAKTFQEVKTMSDFIFDENGELRSFADFKKKAEVTFDQFNKNWLRTELTQAQNTAEAASKWQQFEQEKELFPMLRYDTAGDERVRSSHKALDGIIKPVDSKFWDTHAAPNGWNCRCELLQENEAIETPDEDIETPEDIPESMQFNPGKQKVLFSPEHPYFVVDDQFSGLRDNNFNLPEPGKFVAPGVGFKAAKSIAEAKQRAEALGVDIFRTKGLNINYANNILEVLETVPAAARPNIISDFTNYGKISGRKLGPQGNRNFGVKLHRDDFNIDASEITPELEKKYKLFKNPHTKQALITDHLNIVAFNGRKFKNPIDIVNRKVEIEDIFKKKNESYFIDSALKDERFTMFHEFGHVFDTNKRLTDTEAFADAFADYYTTGGKNLPDYLFKEMDEILK